MLRVLALSYLVVAGCSNKEIVDEVSALSSRACACTAPACADAVVKDVKIWFDKYKDRYGTQADSNNIERSFERMAECLIKTGMSEESTATLIKIGEEAEKL